MSVIEKLTVQGIRSFGTKLEDAQTISFSSPVTLILGQNGCGKTTIIECLKYALTGEVPPGSNRGQNFIHDPKIFNYSESLGQIKLVVKNILHERITVCRSMKIRYKRGKLAFETMDASMTYMATNGEKGDSISKRCMDVDVAMTEFMGVSKAILNNVIFCHQEDSSWPLDESKKLKEKFDAIFGVTEYNKAIERLIKARKEHVAELKLKECNLKYLSHLKQEMEDREISLHKAQAKCNHINELCTSCDNEITPIENRLAEIRKIECDVGKYQALKVELETRRQNYSEQIETITPKLKKIFVGDINKLHEEIQRFDKKIIDKNNEGREMESKLSSLQIMAKGQHGELTELDKKYSLSIQQHQKEQQCRAEQTEKIKLLCEQLNISVYEYFKDGSNKVEDIVKAIQKALLKEQCEIAELTSEADKQDQQRQLQIDDLRVDLTKLEGRILASKRNKEEYEKEYAVVEDKIKEVETSSTQLKKIAADVNRITVCYNQFSTNFKQDELKKSVVNAKANVAKLQQDFHALDQRIVSLSSVANLMTKLSLQLKELEKKEQEVLRVKMKHSDNFNKIFGHSIETNYRRNLQIAYENVRHQIKEMTEDLHALHLKEQSLEFKRKQLQNEVLNGEKQITESRSRIYDECHQTPYDDLVNKCKISVLKFQNEYGALRSAEAMYKKYIKKIEEYPCCPLCHKGFSANDALDLTAELLDEIQRLPSNIENVEKKLMEEQSKYERLLQLKPILHKLTSLETDTPKRKEELKGLEQELADTVNAHEILQSSASEPTVKLDLINSMLGDMSLLDEAVKEIIRIKADISKIKKTLPEEVFEEGALEELQLEKTTILAELENERTLLDKLQTDYEDGIEALNKLREKRNKLKDEQLKLQEGVQTLSQFEDRKNEIANLLKKSTLEINDLQNKVQPLKQNLNSAVMEKNRYKEINRTKIANLQLRFDSKRKIDHELQRLQKDVKDYEKLNLGAELKQLEKSIELIRINFNETTNKISELSNLLDGIKSECINQEALKRDLHDNREIMLIREKKIDADRQLDKLVTQLGDLNFPNINKEKKELMQKRDTVTVRKGELLGQAGEINYQINKLIREMNEPKYKDAVKNYRRSLYEVHIIKSMVADLGHYRVILERSLMQFHAEKMERINRIVREYWRQIYRGNDIDYIQIQTDEGKLEFSADRKRNFNYRVVQCKNNSKSEMRGRCSAGQRVLASLIIRMALAETFTSNCGILALDEPTTNLDLDNILSLCEALNKIIEDRQSESNFMLVIITHDEQFISTLGKIKSYYRVFRDDDGKSVIRSVNVAGL